MKPAVPGYYRESWLDAVRPGDVVRFYSGALRTVLTVSRSDGVRRRGQPCTVPRGYVYSVTFPILHCSWTKRGYTILSRTDLLQRAECVTRARINLERHPTIQAVLRDMAHRPTGQLAARAEDIVAHHEPGSSCCSVVGAIS